MPKTIVRKVSTRTFRRKDAPLPRRRRPLVFNNSGVKSRVADLEKQVRKINLNRKQRGLPSNLTVRKGLIKQARSVAPTKKSWLNNAYSMCRLMPFTHSGSGNSAIPDLTETRRLLIDHRMVNNFTFGSSGTFNIAISPTIPNSVWVNTGSVADITYKINGQTFPNNAGLPNVYVPICQPEWTQLLINRIAVAGDYNTVQTLYGSSKFRIATVGWSLTYTGNVTENSGVIQVTNQRLTTTSDLPDTVTFSVYSSQSGTNTNYTADQIIIGVIDLAPAFGNSLNQGSRMFALSSGANGILKHSGSNFQYCELSNLEKYITPANGPIISMLMQTIPTPPNVGASGICLGLDADWDTTLINIQGGAVGSTFMLDTIYCIEYIPSPSSSTYALSAQGPKENLTIIKKTAEVAANMPIADKGPANADGSVNDVLSKVLTVADVGSKMAGMFM
jgi:hypothetical protein